MRARFGKYSKADLEIFSKLAAGDLEFVRNAAEQRLAVLSKNKEAKEIYLQTVHATRPKDLETTAAMEREMGESHTLLKRLKNSIDPLGIMNPGALIDAD